MPCEYGLANAAGDEAWGDDTTCTGEAFKCLLPSMALLSYSRPIRKCSNLRPSQTAAIPGFGVICGAGSRVKEHSCVACETAKTSISKDYAYLGNTECDWVLGGVECPAGREHHPIEGDLVTPRCMDCPIGKFKGEGPSACNACEDFVNGSITLFQGATCVEDCVCAQGTYGNGGGSGRCHACPAGRSSYAGGIFTPESCFDCLRGSTSESGGICLQCPTGSSTLSPGTPSDEGCHVCDIGYEETSVGCVE